MEKCGIDGNGGRRLITAASGASSLVVESARSIWLGSGPVGDDRLWTGGSHGPEHRETVVASGIVVSHGGGHRSGHWDGGGSFDCAVVFVRVTGKAGNSWRAKAASRGIVPRCGRFAHRSDLPGEWRLWSFHHFGNPGRAFSTRRPRIMPDG